MFNKFKKIFKLSNWKRWTISSISLISMTLAITLGSIYSVSNNKPTIDYKSGAEVVLKLTDPDEKDLEVIINQIEQRLMLNLPEDSTYQVSLNSDNFITITGTNINNDAEMSKFTSFISDKQKPVVTSLVVEYDSQGKPKTLPFEFSNASLSGDSISLDMVSPVTSTTDILVWNDLTGLLNLAATDEYNDEFTAVNRDPYKFLFINGITEDVENGVKAILKTKEFGGFNAIDYLISKNTAPEGGLFSSSLSLDFAFAPKITQEQKEKIFYNLDFAVSTYNLNLQTYNFISPSLGNNAYQFLIIAAAVAFSFLAIFLVVNYGLLGALSTICAAFLIFLGLLMITVFRGEYSAEAIAALMVAVGIGMDFNIAFFERFKKELKAGNSLQKSLKKADKLTIHSSITKALALIITSVLVYVIGSLYLGTFSSLILIMSIFTTVIMFILIRVLTNLILGTKVFDDKKHLFGIYKKTKNITIDTKIENIEKNEFDALTNNIENDALPSKGVAIIKKISVAFLGVFAIVGTVLFTTFSVLGSSLLSGLNAGGSITNPTIIKSTMTFTEDEYNANKDSLINGLGVDESEITRMEVSEGRYLFQISTTTKIDKSKLTDLWEKFQLIDYSIPAEVANKSILNVFYISLACILAMTIFVLVKSDWAYAISMFLTLTIAIILFILLFTLQLFTFNTFFIFGLSSAILISVSNNITVLFRIKEKLKNRKTEELTKSELKKITDVVVKDVWKRLLISNGILVITLLLFTFLPGASNIFFTIPLAIFIIISLIVSTVILPFLFNIFKAYKSKRKREKMLGNHWETQIIEEQIFPGFNDIN